MRNDLCLSVLANKGKEHMASGQCNWIKTDTPQSLRSNPPFCIFCVCTKDPQPMSHLGILAGWRSESCVPIVQASPRFVGVLPNCFSVPLRYFLPLHPYWFQYAGRQDIHVYRTVLIGNSLPPSSFMQRGNSPFQVLVSDNSQQFVQQQAQSACCLA